MAKGFRDVARAFSALSRTTRIETKEPLMTRESPVLSAHYPEQQGLKHLLSLRLFALLFLSAHYPEQEGLKHLTDTGATPLDHFQRIIQNNKD